MGLTTFVAPEISGSPAGVVLRILTGLLVGTCFALCEEVGWRGYMLPRMHGFGLVTAMLLVGLLQGVWHLPLLLTTDYYHPTGNRWIVTALFLTTLTLAGIFFGFLRIWTGSVWPAAVAHSAANMAWGLSSEVSAAKSPLVLEYLGGESGLIVIAGLVIFDIILVRQLPKLKPETYEAHMASENDRSPGGLIALVRRNQIPAFVVLAYALSWWAWFWYRADPENVGAPILPMGPLLAALILLPLIGGWPAVKDLLGRIVRWRVGWRWYLVAVVMPGRADAPRRRHQSAPRGAAAAGLRDPRHRRSRRALRLHLPLDRPRRRARLARLPAAAPARRPQRAGGGADPRGDPRHLARTALRRRIRRRQRRAVGDLRGLLLDRDRWVYLHTGGSILMPMLMHASANTSAVVWRMFEGDDQLRLWWVWSLLWVAMTLAVVLVNGRELGSGARPAS